MRFLTLVANVFFWLIIHARCAVGFFVLTLTVRLVARRVIAPSKVRSVTSEQEICKPFRALSGRKS